MSTLTYARRLLSLTDYAARGREGQRPTGVFTQTITFEPGEVRDVQVRGQLSKNARSGQRFSLEVSQRIGPVVTGNAVIHLEVSVSKAMANPRNHEWPATL